jgi:pre-mRNA cleavage complex 2 protein Pcf11
MEVGDMVAMDYEKQLNTLKDWPDKACIFDLAILAEAQQRYAPEITDVLLARIAHPSTHAALKVPLLYLVDCIMKTVGGAYVRFFSAHIVPVFQRVFDEVRDRVH